MTLQGRRTGRRINAGFDSPTGYTPAPVGGEATDKVSAHLKGIDNTVVGLDNLATPTYHKITSGETSAGYFTLSPVPAVASTVRAIAVNGVEQVNKAVVGSTGVTPDFEMDVTNPGRIYFKNVDAHTGLSEEWTTDDVILVVYVGATA